MSRGLSARRSLLIGILWTIYGLSACSPISTPTSFSPTDLPPSEVTQGITSTQTSSDPKDTTSYVVVRVPRGEKLIVRQPAGQSGTEVGVFEWNAKNVHLTGNRTLLGSSLWVEVEFGVDGVGWVNALNVTEAITAEEFCSDQRVIDLLNSLRGAIEERNLNRLSTLLHETRGLSIRLNWYSPSVHYRVEDVRDLLSNLDEVEWGTMADSGLNIVGAFEQVIFPKLEDVFLRSPEATCNALKYGNTAGKIAWPEELSNMKFYGIYRKPVEDGNEFDWRSWAVGIEYVNGNPFIAILVHYSSEL